MRLNHAVTRRFWTVLAAVVLLTASCSDGDDSANGDNGEDVASPTAVEPTSTSSTTEQSPDSSSSSTTTEPASPEEISVFFGTGDPDVCDAVAPHTRTVPGGADSIRFAFDELVGGPTDQERDQGAFSFFSEETDGTVRSVTTDGRSLVVDFEDFRDDLTPAGANSSCGSGALLGELNATAFQFTTLDLVRYELEGSCDRFGEWLQRGCIEVGRTEWAEAVASQLPGEPFDGILPPGAILAVIGVAADDQLNVRSLPGADPPIVHGLDPLATGLVFSGRERLITPARSVWYALDDGDVVGWVNSRFVAPLNGTTDQTSEILEDAGRRPAAATMEELGDIVIEIRTRFVDGDPPSIVVDGPRSVGDLTEITYDLIGFRDDSILGERLHLFADDSGSGPDRFRLTRVEVTVICARGGGGGGICP